MRVYRLTWLANVDGVDIAFGWHIGEPGRTVTAGIEYDYTSADDVLAQAIDYYGFAVRNVIHVSGTLTSARLVEQLETSDGSVPRGAEASIEAAGLLAGAIRLPKSICAVMRLKSGASVRGGVNWCFLPPPLIEGQMTVDGKWNHATDYWLRCRALADLVEDSFAVGSSTAVPPTDSDARAVVYSQRRRDLHRDPSSWDVSAAEIPDLVHYLRSRRV